MVTTSARLALGVVVVGQLTALGFGIYHLFVPFFEDASIRASVVDTWAIEALFAQIALAAIAIGVAISIGIASRVHDLWCRKVGLATVAIGVAAALVTAFNHAGLTSRTTALTGQNFGSLYGLL